MKFKNALNINCGIKYMFDTLNIKSSLARNVLLESKILKNKQEIDFYYSRVNELFNKNCNELESELCCVKDISSTVKKLNGKDILTDIELFEIKNLAIICGRVSNVIKELGVKKIGIPAMIEILNILDPDKNRVSSFYIYDSYSKELKDVRDRIKKMVGVEGAVAEENKEEYMRLMGENEKIEMGIREILSGKLRKKREELEIGLRNLALLDILTAKIDQIKKMGLCLPVVVDEGETFYCGMFNPYVLDCLRKDGKEFQKVDISFEKAPITIIGANMGGKSVVLKTLALNQLLVQFGFGVAAKSCCVCVVDDVFLCSDAEQSVKKGISSFGAEILAINEIINKAKSGENVLALIDEPARTTNPIEGCVLVEGLIDVVKDLNSKFIITTHYNIDNEGIKRYRVKGLVNGEMDYSLLEVYTGEIPHEAINIALNLDIDNQWINNAKNRLKKNNN